MEETWILRGICLLAGALFGAATGVAQELARFCKAAGHTGRDARRTPRRVRLLADVMKTAAVCALCHAALAPEMEESAALYAGAGRCWAIFAPNEKMTPGSVRRPWSAHGSRSICRSQGWSAYWRGWWWRWGPENSAGVWRWSRRWRRRQPGCNLTGRAPFLWRPHFCCLPGMEKPLPGRRIREKCPSRPAKAGNSALYVL